MAKRRVYNGVYKRSNTPCRLVNSSNQNRSDIQIFTHTILKYLWMAYSIVVNNYVTIVTFAVVVLLGLLLPFSHVQKKNDLEEIKKVLDKMTEEVTRAEVACLTAADDVCSLRCSICDEQTETTQELRDLSICTSRGLFETRSEPVQVEKKIGFFRRIFSLNRNISRKEIAIMSIVYTESFGV